MPMHHRITVRLCDEDAQAMKILCKRNQWSVSDMFRYLLRNYTLAVVTKEAQP